MSLKSALQKSKQFSTDVALLLQYYPWSSFFFSIKLVSWVGKALQFWCQKLFALILELHYIVGIVIKLINMCDKHLGS